VIPRRISLDRVHCIYIKEYAVVETTVCFIVGVLPDNVFKQDPLFMSLGVINHGMSLSVL
jgi:hypothetical protein